MEKLNNIYLFLFLITSACLSGCTSLSKQEGVIPFPEALEKAAIIQDSIPDVANNSLLIGNGDINGLVNIINGKLIIRLTKNDVGDWRNDTSKDSTLFPWAKIRELGALGKLSSKRTGTMGWHRYPYACPIPCGKLVINLPDNKDTKSKLDLRKALVSIGNEKSGHSPAAIVRCLYQVNCFLIEGGTKADLLSHEVEHLPGTEHSVKGNLITLYQKLPSDSDWPGMSYAVALVEKGKRTVVSIVTSFEADDPLAEAIALAEGTVATNPRKLVAEHEEDWRSFWTKSGIQLDDEYLTSTWYRNLYFLRTVSRPDKPTIGLFAGLVHDGKPAWHSAHTMNYNAEQPFWTAFSCNHIELASSYRWLISRYYDNSKWLCRQLFDFNGVYFPHNLFTFQPGHSASKQPGNGVHMHYPWGYSTGNTGWAVQNLWWEFEYGGRDTVFLRKIYPLIRDAAQFYSNFILSCEKMADGKVKYGPSVSPEHFGFSSDLSKNWNDVHALSFARFTLEAAIKGAQFLQCDTDLGKKFAEALGLLPDYPVFGNGDNRVVVLAEGTEPMMCNIPDPVCPVFPCEQVTWFSSDDQKSLFGRTIETLRSNGNNDAMILCHARARLSLPGTFDYVVNSFRQRQRPNGILTLNVIGDRWKQYNNHGHYTEQFAASAVVSELLLQSVDDIIRVFPAWSAEKNASFSDLRAKGGFLVSSEMKNNSVQNIRIQCTSGGTLKLLNPWKASKVKVTGLNGKQQLISSDPAGIITIETIKDQIFELQPVED